MRPSAYAAVAVLAVALAVVGAATAAAAPAARPVKVAPAAWWPGRTAPSSSCSAAYKPRRNLLFGAVSSQCTKGCAPRDDQWGQICSGAAGAWGTASPQQTQAVVDVAKQISGGAMLDFSPCDLEPYLRGRTLWLLGDSFTKQTYRALQCFLIDFWDHQECEASPDASAVQELMMLPRMAGTTKCFHLSGPQGGRVCFAHVVLGTSLVNNTEVAMGGVLPLLRAKFAQPQDIFSINFGMWHRKKPDSDWLTYRPALHALGKFYQATKAEWPHLLWKEIPAQHPPPRANSSSNSCLPLTGFDFEPQDGSVRRVAGQAPQVSDAPPYEGKVWDVETPWANVQLFPRHVLPRYDLPIVRGFNASVPLPSAHVGPNGLAVDCMHYAHPGVPEMNVWFLYEAFRSGVADVKPLPASVKQDNTCVRSTTAGFLV